MILDDFPIGNSPLIPAPHIEEAVPQSIDKLEQLLESRPDSTNLIFALANLNYHSGNYSNSENLFRKGLKIKPDNYSLLSNLALVLYVQNKNSEAKKYFDKALSLKPKLEHSLYFQAHLALSESKKTSALKMFEKLVEDFPKNHKALAILGGLYQENGEEKKARELYQKVVRLGVSIPWVEHQLCKLEFFSGKEKFVIGKYFEAFEIWKKADNQFESSFVADKTISKELKELQQQFKKDNCLEDLVQKYALSKRSEEGVVESFYHELLSALYFELGLFPEFYFRPEEIEKDRAVWEEALESRGDHPYAWFRIAVGFSFEGRLSEALSVFLRCMDNLLPKKQDSLGLRHIVRFIKRLDRFPGPDSLKRSDRPKTEWEEYGFTEMMERELWISNGFEPLAARNWKSCGLLPKQAREWASTGHNPKTASLWIDKNIEDPKIARIFDKGGVPPADATGWLEIFRGSENQAVQFYSAGIKDPEQANEWMNVFNMPWDAGKWNELGFSPAETGEWFRQGVSDPFEAKRLTTKDSDDKKQEN